MLLRKKGALNISISIELARYLRYDTFLLVFLIIFVTLRWNDRNVAREITFRDIILGGTTTVGRCWFLN